MRHEDRSTASSRRPVPWFRDQSSDLKSASIADNCPINQPPLRNMYFKSSREGCPVSSKPLADW